MEQDLKLIELANEFFLYIETDSSLLRYRYFPQSNYQTLETLSGTVLTDRKSAMCYSLSNLYNSQSITDDHIAIVERLAKRYGNETLATYSSTVSHTLADLSKKFLFHSNYETNYNYLYCRDNLHEAIKLLKAEKKIAQIGRGWGKGVFIFSSGPIEVDDETVNEELKSSRLEKILQAKEAEILYKNKQIEDLTQAVANQTAMNWT